MKLVVVFDLALTAVLALIPILASDCLLDGNGLHDARPCRRGLSLR